MPNPQASQAEATIAPDSGPTASLLARYDFIDIGASKGGSIDFARNKLGGVRGLGIDINAAKVEQARRLGYDCLQADITKTPLPSKSVRFVVMSHVLEHVALHDVVKVIERAKEAATDFIYIQGPYFDADAYLRQRGLKFYWSDWHGHTCHLTSTILRSALARVQLDDYAMMGRARVDDSLDPSIHPVESPRDQHDYDPTKHPPKPSMRFNPPLYRELICVVRLRDFRGWKKILNARSACDPIIR